MLNLAELKKKLRAPLCAVQWVIPYESGEGFSVGADGAIIDGADCQLTMATLMPLSSDGLLVWQSALESIGALTLGGLGDSSDAVAKAIDSEDEASLEPYRIVLLSAAAAAAADVRDIQAKALERILGVPVGSANLVRTIDLGEDLFKAAWDTVSAALAPKPTEGKKKAKTKVEAKTEEF